jgi:uncharacterized protein YrrD
MFRETTMRKGSELIGKPVVSYDTGQRLDTIHDLIFDQAYNVLLGFVVDEGGWFSAARVLPLERVQVIGPDAVIVANAQSVLAADAVPAFEKILGNNNVLRGTKIVTTDGRDLGTFVDLYFDEQTGAIEGYEVSGGLFADSTTGRSFIPAPETLKIGNDVAFVPPETADLMAERTIGTPTNDAPPTVEDTLGQRAEHAVRTDEGLIIVAPGQIVTELVISRARTYGKEDDLIRAVGGHAPTTGSQARETLADGTQQVKAGAATLWERVKGSISATQERAAQEREERRIRYALGRPTSRVILDPQDNVILNVGELITHQAVERARAAGALDMLLGSVYDKDPELAQEALRAPESGQASLEQHHGKQLDG